MAKLWQMCQRCKRETSTSIHGTCLKCGAEKFHSKVLEERSKKRNK